MIKSTPMPVEDSGHAKRPDFSIPNAAARQAAAKLYRKADKKHTKQLDADCPPQPSGAPAKP